MQIADALKNLNFHLESRACRQRRNEFERVPKYLYGITVRKSAGCVLGRKHETMHGPLVVAPFFEVQRQFRGQFRFSVSAGHEPFSQTQVKLGSIDARDPVIE